LWISGGQIESRAESDAVVRAMGSELYGSVGKGSRPELHQPPRYVWSARPLPSAPPRSEASSAHPGSDYEFRSKFFFQIFSVEFWIHGVESANLSFSFWVQVEWLIVFLIFGQFCTLFLSRSQISYCSQSVFIIFGECVVPNSIIP
jgi:hypothetical protein